MIPEIVHLYNILSSFLGEAKNGFDGENMQLQFPCPRCIERDGIDEARKYNLEVNLQKQLFHCWKCSSNDDDEMHGSIIKLIRMYGNEKLLKDYKETIKSLKESSLYKLKFTENDFNVHKSIIPKELEIPSSFKLFQYGKNNPSTAMDYLFKRGINWPIINDFKIGYTSYQEDNKMVSNRIIIPSYDKFGELNYWTGRDFSGLDKRQKYFNPKVERKNIIFNEEKIQWDADITLVEGPFDHLVVPNSIPLLGKVISPEFKLYWEINEKANANINIFLDGDAFESVKVAYKTLNHGNLYGRIRYIPVNEDMDPSLLFQLGGNKAIIQHLANAIKIKEAYL